MVEHHICTFCGEPLEPGTGKMYVRKDGSIYYFCGPKCQNNYRLGRVPRRVVWTKAGRKALGKD
ncbi:50S ribosomal protein L24e [Methanogenium organophilum]|uniref:Large ribosomal subunit protein eL24 n=1 Tax=Methanogenium organophilum TaxID=2199 RepID=A0A9X9S322_METOG|nr:50S ribosomal protein L24e [Methanogenium organophilum]WAI00592.1 50S ribosomal protein L24e [Methanogenium organophilum]